MKVSKMKEQRTFYRHNRQRVIFGLCSGLGEYLHIDPNIIRVVWVAFSIVIPGGILLYLLAPLVVPVQVEDEDPVTPLFRRNHLLAFLFVGIGLLLLISQYHFWDSRWFNLVDIPMDALLAIILIVAGLLVFFFGGVRRDPMYFAIEGEKRLLRSPHERKLLGVCGGIANYFGTDPSLVRLFFVAGTIISIWLGIILYIILSLLMPVEPSDPLLEEDDETEGDSTP
jgi:phage shock protein C